MYRITHPYYVERTEYQSGENTDTGDLWKIVGQTYDNSKTHGQSETRRQNEGDR